MTFEDAVIKAIKAYYAGKEPTKILEVQKPKKFSKSYYDEIEKQFVVEDKKSKKKKDEATDGN